MCRSCMINYVVNLGEKFEAHEHLLNLFINANSLFYRVGQLSLKVKVHSEAAPTLLVLKGIPQGASLKFLPELSASSVFSGSRSPVVSGKSSPRKPETTPRQPMTTKGRGSQWARSPSMLRAKTPPTLPTVLRDGSTGGIN